MTVRTNSLAVMGNDLAIRSENNEKALKTWLNTLDSPNTRKSYEKSVREALTRLGGLSGCTPGALSEWRMYLMGRMEADDLSPASISLRLAALRSFLRFARIAGVLPLTEEAIKLLLKSPKSHVMKPYQTLGWEEASELMNAARRPRDRALVALLLGSGLRASEIVKLRLADFFVDADGDVLLRVRAGKGRKDRLVPLPQRVVGELYSYLSSRRMRIGNKEDAESVLFPSRKGQNKAITTARLRQLVDELMETAGISKAISPHSFRHTYAMMLLRRGANLVAVQKLLGHASLSTTQRYLDHLDIRDLKQAVGLKA